jgi:hypothetical protein
LHHGVHGDDRHIRIAGLDVRIKRGPDAHGNGLFTDSLFKF